MQRTDIGVRSVEPAALPPQVLQPGRPHPVHRRRARLRADQSIDVIANRLTALTDAVAKQKCAGGATTDGCRAAEPTDVVVLRDGERIRSRSAASTTRSSSACGWVLVRRGLYAAGRPGRGRRSQRLVDVERHDAHRRSPGKIFVCSKARKDVSGVVGSYEATRQSFAFDTTQALRILALISLSLGVINLFPFLPLDGGHIFWAIAEKIRGRPIPFAVLERASVIGIMLVALLFVIGLSNDIGRITSGEGFGVR